MMNTPICNFAAAYQSSGKLRFHMPGHKGTPIIGPEGLDITEIDGADVLYDAKGIIRESECSASALFGTADTLYSTEGSSLCIRAMLYLAVLHAKMQRRRPLILAGRNAHKVFITGAALVDAEVSWIFSEEEGNPISCRIDPAALEERLMEERPAAVYITSPDYLGTMSDVRTLADVCHRHNALLLVDNAHGAYTRFLSPSLHPMDQGADLCCDSAHKTLPVLTGGAYLHISQRAPEALAEHAQRALSLFASTSPSYLILQSLDAATPYLAGEYPAQLSRVIRRISQLKTALVNAGFRLMGDEPLKLTLAAKAIGYTGTELSEHLAENGMVCEFCDPDFVVLMFTPQTSDEALDQLENVLLTLPKHPALSARPPLLAKPVRVMSAREALFAPQETIPSSQALGRVLASATVNCPPAIPIVACGEKIDETALACFAYYGIEECCVVTEAAE